MRTFGVSLSKLPRRRFASALWLLIAFWPALAMAADKPWLTLPATPKLPVAERNGYAAVNGIKIWYAAFGNGEPVILLHGGLANSNYWGTIVPELSGQYRIIVMDSRGHGRSSRNQEPFGYELMASDVLGLMDVLGIPKAAIVGWSDGAIIGLQIAIKHPERLSRLFAFAANSDPSGVKDVDQSPVFKEFTARAEEEYRKLSPTSDQFKTFLEQITNMWATQPHFTAEQLAGIKVPTWIVDADHDEAIVRDNTLFMADKIPGAALLIQPAVSHFSLLQDPQQFSGDVLRFLERTKSR